MRPGQAKRYEFSANTGYLWTELPFLDRIRQAAAHGFDAVEFHDEARRTDRQELKEVLAETALPAGGINVRMEETFGCAAIPGQGDQAKRDVDEAIEIAEDVDADAIHVLAGLAFGQAAHAAFLKTLRHALGHTDRTILIEPVCAEQLPGYFLRTVEQAAEVLSDIGHPRLKIMFDCYHVFRESGDLFANFSAHAGNIGHVQIAAAESRAEPFPGVIDYGDLLPAMRSCGYAGRIGCEYRPVGPTEDGLSWRDAFRDHAGTAEARAAAHVASQPGA
ncbi:MAG: TIM barrel protein [Boseongicola sp. SB0675_bin_26]|nr:TIM barrel protein [Boseongicola sp. SB0675_bin_26]